MSRLELAERVIELRERADLTQGEAAKKAGVGVTTWSNIETGAITRPHARTLIKIARALGVEPEELASPKAQAPQPEPPEEIYDPRASDLRRENYLMTLLLFAKRQRMHWEKELDERLSAPTAEFFGWAGGVFKTVHILSDSLFEGEVFSHSFGTISDAEEDYRSVLLRDVWKMLRITKQLLTEWDRRVNAMKDDTAAKKQRLEMEHYNKEFQRIVAANFSESSEHLVGG